jgi:uncharacterized protein (TIGR00255 family)
MTGYGRGEASDGVRVAVCEIKSVNHRYGEFTVRMPRRYAFAEDRVRQAVRSKVARGKVEVSLSLTSSAEEESAVSVNLAAAKQYFKGLTEIKSEFGLNGEVTLELIAGMPDVLKSSSDKIDEEAITEVLISSTLQAAENFNKMRTIEGEKLAEDLLNRAGTIEQILQQIDGRAPELTVIYQGRLQSRIEELLAKGGYSVDGVAERIALEVAVFADKSNITEEIVRQRSHISQLQTILTGKDSQPAGKKLDFLVQEINREANTIGSKANDLKITDLMLDMKAEVEKIREQVQNLE